MWICNHCHQEHAFTKTSDKANHSRWCTKNPKRNETENLGIAQQKNMIQKIHWFWLLLFEKGLL